MNQFIQLIKSAGAYSLDNLWFPLLIWTICTAIAFLVLRLKKMNPLHQYHLRTAAILALPAGLLLAGMVRMIPDWLSSPEMETAVFVVQNPIQALPVSAAQEAVISWNEPVFYIGLITGLLLLVSCIQLVRFVNSYITLRRLYGQLKTVPLSSIDAEASESTGRPVRVAYNDHPLVPFTFGWKQPVVVLPSVIKGDKEKQAMALHHELVHIRRRDYLLQLVLSMIESLFWFHPLIRYGSKEIDTYREISCDQEVLNRHAFSPKKYASLLVQLVPLQTGPGALSVSMAVRESTLKQRIQTMQYHTLYRSSLKRSIVFLLLMVLGITLPIACSDLRGPDAVSMDKLENTSFIISGGTVTANGDEIFTLEKGSGITSTGLYALVINLNDHGIFKISPARFDGAKQLGTVSGNVIEFTHGSVNYRIQTESEILNNINSAPIWVDHTATSLTGFTHGSVPAGTPLNDFLTRYKNNSKSSSSASDKKEDFFVVVEKMPEPIGGMAGVQSRVQYPDMARRAGIEGRVTVRFVVNEEGNVENAEVVRGIGGGADQEALRVVRETKFKPGIQRGKPVRVQFALSVNFKLENSDISSGNSSSTPPEQDLKQIPFEMDLQINTAEDGKIEGYIFDHNGNPLPGANIAVPSLNKGGVTNRDGKFSITNLEDGSHNIRISYIGYKTLVRSIQVQ